MHGLHNKFYFERKNIHIAFLFSFSFLADFVFVFGFWLFFFFGFFCFVLGMVLAILTKCSILHVAGFLDPTQYAPTWIAYKNI